MPAKANSEELEGKGSKLACKGISAPPLPPPRCPGFQRHVKGGFPCRERSPILLFVTGAMVSPYWRRSQPHSALSHRVRKSAFSRGSGTL